MKFLSALLVSGAVAFAAGAKDYFEVKGGEGPGKGKKIVLLAGDEEYRSEEALPMLAKILAKHGFDATVCFSVGPDGVINPDQQDSLTNPDALDSADLIVTSLRFRKWPDATMAKFDAAMKRGVPVVGLRTSTHAFSGLKGDYAKYNKFGKEVLGEQWVSHWGHHKVQAMLGIVEPGAEGSALLHGVKDVFVESDTYEAYPPADATILMRGQVLKGMTPDSGVADHKKKRATDKMEQGVNDPMMPVAWTRIHKQDNGKENKIFTTTMGAASDLDNEGLRRLVINAIFWGLGLDVPQKADVETVGEFKPTFYGFKTYIKGVKPDDIK